MNEGRGGKATPGYLSLMLITSVSHFINDGESAFFPVLLPLIAYAVTDRIAAAVVVAVFYIFSSFLSPVTTSLSHRRGNPGRGMGAGLLFLGLGVMSTGLSLFRDTGSFSFVFLTLSAALAGFGASFYHPLGSHLIQHNISGSNAGLAMGVNGSAGSLGRALYSTIFVAAFEAFSLPWGMIAIGASGGAVALLVMYFFRGESANIEQTRSVRGAVGPVIRSSWLLLLITVVRNVAGTGVLIFLPLYLISVHFISYSISLGLLLTLTLGLGIVGQPLFGRASDRLGKSVTLFITTFGTGLLLILLIWVRTLFATLLFLPLFGMFAYSGFPVLFPVVFSRLQPEYRPIGGSVVWAAIGAGSAAGPLIVAFLSTGQALGSLGNAFIALAFATLIVSFLSFAAARERLDGMHLS